MFSNIAQLHNTYIIVAESEWDDFCRWADSQKLHWHSTATASAYCPFSSSIYRDMRDSYGDKIGILINAAHKVLKWSIAKLITTSRLRIPFAYIVMDNSVSPINASDLERLLSGKDDCYVCL